MKRFASEEALYRQYMEFFEKAERKRRWSVFDDIPWDQWREEWGSEELAICAETFCGVEMYLPDYTAQGLNLVRQSFGQAWFQANWGYEESKHSFALREYLVRTGLRTEEQMRDFERRVLEKRWTMPFETPREMAVYGSLQEKATWMIYRMQLQHAKQRGDVVLSTIYRFAARDEAAHASFYQDTLRLCLDEDRAGTIADMAHVIRHFRMPAYDLIPDYDERVSVMRSVGIDHRLFFKDVVFPILKRAGVTRRELTEAMQRTREAERALAAAARNGGHEVGQSGQATENAPDQPDEVRVATEAGSRAPGRE